jgi:hypothetical protein
MTPCSPTTVHPQCHSNFEFPSSTPIRRCRPPTAVRFADAEAAASAVKAAASASPLDDPRQRQAFNAPAFAAQIQSIPRLNNALK